MEALIILAVIGVSLLVMERKKLDMYYHWWRRGRGGTPTVQDCKQSRTLFVGEIERKAR